MYEIYHDKSVRFVSEESRECCSNSFSLGQHPVKRRLLFPNMTLQLRINATMNQFKLITTFLAVIAVIILCCFAGCAPRHTVHKASIDIPSPEYILQKIHQNDRTRIGLQGTAKVSVDAPNGRYVRNVAVIVERPARLRLEAIPYFGTPDFLLSVNDGVLKVFLPGEGHFYIGRSTKENLFSFFRIMLDAEEIIPLLTGALPPTIPGTAQLRGTMTENQYRIDAIDNGGIISSFWVDPEHETVKRITLYDRNGSILYSAAYEDHHYIEKTLFPHKIVISMEKPKKILATIRYSKLGPLQRSNSEELFDLPIPSGIKPIIIE